jgi:beta-glucosidase
MNQGKVIVKPILTYRSLDLDLLKAVSKRHSDVVAIIFSGRPLILTPVAQHVKGILQANLPGTEAGNALYELLFGLESPSGKLAMTYPYHAGQVPIYYNHTPTGRPLKEEDPMYRYRTHYIDVPNDPLYPFGFGLNYGDIRIEEVVSSSLCDEKMPYQVTITLKNHGSHSATEVLQGYIEALSYSVSRPVNELKRFERVTLNPGETKSIEWVIPLDDFRSYNKNMQWTAEKRLYQVKFGFSSKTTHVFAVDVKDSVY